MKTDMAAGTVINVFEAVDVITLIKGGVYDDLNLTVGDALLKRPDVGLSAFRHPHSDHSHHSEVLLTLFKRTSPASTLAQ